MQSFEERKLLISESCLKVYPSEFRLCQLPLFIYFFQCKFIPNICGVLHFDTLDLYFEVLNDKSKQLCHFLVLASPNWVFLVVPLLRPTPQTPWTMTYCKWKPNPCHLDPRTWCTNLYTRTDHRVHIPCLEELLCIIILELELAICPLADSVQVGNLYWYWSKLYISGL